MRLYFDQRSGKKDVRMQLKLRDSKVPTLKHNSWINLFPILKTATGSFFKTKLTVHGVKCVIF